MNIQDFQNYSQEGLDYAEEISRITNDRFMSAGEKQDTISDLIPPRESLDEYIARQERKAS